MLRDLKKHDSFSGMFGNDRRVEKRKLRGCNNERVDRRNVVELVAEIAKPGGAGRFGSPRQISPDRGLGDLDAEVEQFAMDAGRGPKRVGQAHLRDQIADLGARPGRSEAA